VVNRSTVAGTTGLPYVGRFAPSPTGPLHAGSLVAALASWLDARAHGGRWLLRIEDVDTPRCVPGMAQHIAAQLAACGLVPDAPPWLQSTRSDAYSAALQQLRERGLAYECGCTRRDIDIALQGVGQVHQRHEERIYPGTCRLGLQGKPARAVRLLTLQHGHDAVIDWQDRRLGALRQNVTREVGDFVLRRADGLWAYQLAVVVDDAAQGITHVVRGEDLADNTPRQMLLQQSLGLPAPAYLHTPLVLAVDGQKLSKQNGAQSLETGDPLASLQSAAGALGLRLPEAKHRGQWLSAAVAAWRDRWIR